MSKLLKSKFLMGVVMFAAVFVIAGSALAADGAISMTLKYGMKNIQVKYLQQSLNEAGFGVDGTGAGSAGNETTFFGNATKAAVKTFQAANQLTADGVFGPMSRAALTVATPVVSSNFPAGCTSATGFSSTTGASCATGVVNAYAPGCTSTSGFSTTTGVSCATTTTTTTGTVTVALASDNTVASTVISDTALVMQNSAPVMKLTFTNGNSTEVKVNTIKLTRTGFAADADVNNLYLYDGSAKVAELSSTANKVFTFNSSAGLFAIPANSSKTVWVGMNVTPNVGNAKTIGFNIVSATDVVTSSTTATAGSFPLTGNLMTVASVTDLGYVNLTNTTTFPSTINPSSSAQELWRFTATANDQKMQIKKLVLTMVGTVASTDIQNLALTVGGTQIGSTASLDTDNKLTFDLSAAPYEIASGQNRTFVLTGEVVKGTGRAFKFTIRSKADVVAFDTNYAVDTTPLLNGAAFTVVDPDPTGDGSNINNGTVTITKSSTSPTGNVPAGASDVTLAKFDYKANGEDVKVSYVNVKVNEETSDFGINDVKLYFNGSQVGTTIDPADEATSIFTLGNTVVVAAGTTGVFEVRANIEKADGTDLVAGQTIVVSLIAGTTDATGQSSLANITTSGVTANTLTVAAGTMTVAKNNSLANFSATNPTAVKGAAGVKIGSFTISAGSGEGSTINQLKLKDSLTSPATEVVANGAPFVEGVNDNTLAAGETVTLTVAAANKYLVGEVYGIAKTGTLTTASTMTVVTATGVTVTATIDTAVAISDATDGVTIAQSWSGGAAVVNTLADAFQNLKVMNGSTQIGSVVGTLTDTAASEYTFSVSPSISFNAGEQKVFDVYADLKTSASTFDINNDASGVMFVSAVSSSGNTTSTSLDVTGTNAAPYQLQNVFISGTGSLAMSQDADTAIAATVIMGQTDVSLAKIKLTAGISENISISRIKVLGTGNSGSFSNVKLFDGAAQIGSTVSGFDALTGGYAEFVLATPLVITKNLSKVLTVKADVNADPNATSAGTIVISINAAGDIDSLGENSGASIAETGATAGGNTMTVYRTKLTVTHASDSPSGSSTGSLQQIVAKFVVSNAANVGAFDAVLKGMTVNMGSTIVNTADSLKYVTFYKTSVSGTVPNEGNSGVGSGNALASIGVEDVNNGTNPCTTAGNLTCVTASPVTKFTNTAINEAAFSDVTIASGASVTIIVVADTDDAATGKNFSAGLSAGSVEWSDGVTTNITTVDSLPLVGKTLTY